MLGVLCSAAGHSSLQTSVFGGQNHSHATAATDRGGGGSRRSNRAHTPHGKGHNDHTDTDLLSGRHVDDSVNVLDGSTLTTRR